MLLRWTHIAITMCAIAAAAVTPARASTVEAGFTPPPFGGKSAEDVVLEGIADARQSIRVAAYSFTSKPIATALVAAAKGSRHVDVRVVADKKSNSGRYTAVTFLANSGIPVRLNGRYAIMHNKFMVIDGENVETGSFNFTDAAAHHNAENAILHRQFEQLAAVYSREWTRLWDESEPVQPRY